MTLAQRRIVQEFETQKLPAFQSRVDEAAGVAIPMEVHWDTLAVAGEEHNYAECWPQIYFEPLIAAIKEVARDEMGREALKTAVTKIVVQNVKGCVYGDCWADLQDGVLTLDHGSIENACDVEGRKKGLAAVLEQGL